VNDALCEAVGLLDATPAGESSVGRLARTAVPMELDRFARHVRQALGAPNVRVAGRGSRPIQNIYAVSGAGRCEIAHAARSGADCMLTGEIGYHDAQEALASGLCTVEAGHYPTEQPILQRMERHLQSQLQRLQYTVRTAVHEVSTCPFRYPDG
jgi:putative NIF3 family GTP cyclohydrolase 1 type 2